MHPVASKPGSPAGPAGAETLKPYRQVAAVQVLVAPVRCQSHEAALAGMAAADALTVRRAIAEIFVNMMVISRPA
jgi:hypothetical protein